MSLRISVFLALAAFLCLFQQSLGAATELSSVELQERLCALDSQFCTEHALAGVEDEDLHADVEETEEDEENFEGAVEKDSEEQQELKDNEDEDFGLAENENTEVEGRARRAGRRRGRKGRKGRKTRRGVRKSRRGRKPKRNNRKRRNNRRTRRKNNRG